VHLDMVPRFRKLQESSDDAVERATRLLNDLVRAEVELDRTFDLRTGQGIGPDCANLKIYQIALTENSQMLITL
jgi:hypothetical protein